MYTCAHVKTASFVHVQKVKCRYTYIDEDIHQAWIGNWHAIAVAVLIKVTATYTNLSLSHSLL